MTFQKIRRCILVEMIVISALIASLENQKSRKYFFFSFWTQNRENFEIKAKGRHLKQDFCMSYTGRIILVYFFHICDMQQVMKI